MITASRANFKATATDLHLCQRCPRLLACQKTGDRHAWKVGIVGSGKNYGTLFHQHIADRFHADAATPESPCRHELAEALSGGAANLKTKLDALIRAQYFNPFLAAHSKTLKADQLMALAKATAFWIGCLADFLLKIPSLFAEPAKQLGAVFRPPERTLRVIHSYPDGQTLRVSGRYDCLLFDPDAGRAVLFEFKGFRASDPTVELSQTLIYAWLVFSATGIVPSVKLIYLEDNKPLDVSPDKVERMMGNLSHLFDVGRQVLERRLPLPAAADSALCRTCPCNAHCDKDWGARIAAEATGAKKSLKAQDLNGVQDKEQNKGQDEKQDEGQERMNRLLEALRYHRLAVEDRGYVYGPSFIRLKIGLDMSKTGTTVRRVENTAKDLQVALALPSPPLIAAQSGYVSVDVPRNVRQILALADMMKMAEPTRPKSAAAFPLGLDIDGNVFWVDLAEPIMTSILIGGTSGSGKSVLLRSIVMGLLLCAPPESVSLTLIDPKRVTFTDLKTLRCLEEGTLLLDTDAAMKALSATSGEIERRYVLMEEAGVPDIVGYNEQSADRLKRRVVILDEYADMIVSAQTRADLELSVQRICQKGRAAGIHLILATQRPDAKVVTGIIKANLQLRVALKVTSASNSQIILGEGAGQAQYLLGHGDMLVGGSVPLQRLQAPLATADLLGQEYRR
ncbi:MAG: PD-(D/E)XK nuclease family protein [Synergistaceae bacterium]|jgi:S-DNA-T family DNA segregation ATPase FtsK/SpoIIIE|nr:PD-(D/E)XK nuclease family protein [Synergistaceae bacterium]